MCSFKQIAQKVNAHKLQVQVLHGTQPLLFLCSPPPGPGTIRDIRRGGPFFSNFFFFFFLFSSLPSSSLPIDFARLLQFRNFVLPSFGQYFTRLLAASRFQAKLAVEGKVGGPIVSEKEGKGKKSSEISQRKYKKRQQHK